MNRIYLDHAASSPLIPEVIDTMMNTARLVHGNPSSIHREGVIAKNIIEESRKSLANFLHTSSGQVFFTSGATESNNIVLHSAIASGKIQHIITSPIEHPAILNTIQYYNRHNNVEVHYLKPSTQGVIDLIELEEKLKITGRSTLVCLIHTHNELGSILPLEECASLCVRYGASLHSDTVQSIGLLDINVSIPGLSSIVGSAHKFNGPKGIGFLYLQDPAHYEPLLYGGSQERNMRGGTENIIGITGMIKALEIAYAEREQRLSHLFNLHSTLKKGLIELNSNIEFNTPENNFLPKILSVYFEERKNLEWLILNLDIEGIAVSGGSACSSGTEKASPVNEYIRPGSKGKNVRFSMSHLNTVEEIENVLGVLKKLFV